MRYYSSIYSTRVDYETSDLRAHLDWVDFPTLSQDSSEKLEQDITLEEVQIAMAQLQPGKTPGADGIPVEFYSTYQELLAPRLT